MKHGDRIQAVLARGVYGGNVITCKEPRFGPEKVVGYLECLKKCTDDAACRLVALKGPGFCSGGEAYEFMGDTKDDRADGTCTTNSDCNGVYSEDSETKRRVG